MRADERLRDELHRDWSDLMERVKVANRDILERISNESLVFELDLNEDSLRVAIGARPGFAYTQGTDHVYLDIDADTDRVVAITIEGFSDYVRQHKYDALTDLAAALKRVGRIELPTESRREEVARELRELVPT